MKRYLITLLVVSGVLFAFWGAAEAGIISGESNFSVFLKAGGTTLLKSEELSVLSDDGQRPYLADAVSQFDPEWGSNEGGKPIGDWFDGGMDGAPEVPEPATMIMLGGLAAGLFGAAGIRKGGVIS